MANFSIGRPQSCIPGIIENELYPKGLQPLQYVRPNLLAGSSIVEASVCACEIFLVRECLIPLLDEAISFLFLGLGAISGEFCGDWKDFEDMVLAYIGHPWVGFGPWISGKFFLRTDPTHCVAGNRVIPRAPPVVACLLHRGARLTPVPVVSFLAH
ncbi:hypothetical protein HAX54_038023 [Datura stramonium]|uniref:Uncharacterized protein n=1 Tax=Datura stramonium TaxID=4076 RepID=A0ABS8VKQ3_DATST|nr:hypothetical protein [Datura stramonium]